jgi:hypothetical protein
VPLARRRAATAAAHGRCSGGRKHAGAHHAVGPRGAESSPPGRVPPGECGERDACDAGVPAPASLSGGHIQRGERTLGGVGVGMRCGWAFQVVLQCAVATEDSVRGKAIRLVANKLFPLPALAPAVESFARQALRRAVPPQRSADGAEAEAEADVQAEVAAEAEVQPSTLADDSCGLGVHQLDARPRLN